LTGKTRAAVQIRDETRADLSGIREVHRAAFDSPAEARLVDLLRERGKAPISLVAEASGQIVGHILFSPISIEPPHPGWHGLGLAPLAVIPDWQKRGIGMALVHQGLACCRELGAGLVVVLGAPVYYGRFGFQRADDFGLGNEYGAEEHFMVLELKPGVLVQFNGVVKYEPEFEESGA
jgi:putative acetyltransferase